MENLNKIQINIINKFVKYFNRKFKNGDIKIAFLLKPSDETYPNLNLLLLFKNKYGWHIDYRDIDKFKYLYISKYIDENKIIGNYKTAWHYPICLMSHIEMNINGAGYNHKDENDELKKLQRLIRRFK